MNSFIDYENWTNGKILDDCVDSNDEELTLYTYNPITTQTDSYWVGDGLKDGITCVNLLGNSLAGTLAKRFINYLVENVQKNVE